MFLTLLLLCAYLWYAFGNVHRHYDDLPHMFHTHFLLLILIILFLLPIFIAYHSADSNTFTPSGWFVYEYDFTKKIAIAAFFYPFSLFIIFRIYYDDYKEWLYSIFLPIVIVLYSYIAIWKIYIQ